VAAQFAAIMTASGFGDRVIVGTLPDPPHDRRPRVRYGNPRWHRSRRRATTAPRVRSPPGRWWSIRGARSPAGGLRAGAEGSS